MKKVGIALAITALFALIGVFTYAALNNSANVVKTAQSAPSTVSEQPKPPTRPELLTLVNAERKKYGAKPLVIDERLNKSAQYKADDMVKYNYRAHVNPKTGMHGYEYINQVGIYCKTDSENLTWDSKTAKESFNWWVHSKPHHLAMINKSYSLTGFGIAEQESYYFIVEHFCQV